MLALLEEILSLFVCFYFVAIIISESLKCLSFCAFVEHAWHWHGISLEGDKWGRAEGHFSNALDFVLTTCGVNCELSLSQQVSTSNQEKAWSSGWCSRYRLDYSHSVQSSYIYRRIDLYPTGICSLRLIMLFDKL